MNKATIRLIFIMIGIVVIGITIANSYYGAINDAEDSRVFEAKRQYKTYNNFVKQNDYKSVFATLDTIENIYLQFDDYKNSYELGVVYNNKSAVWLSLALKKASNNKNKQVELDSAKKYSEKSIIIYQNWLSEFENLSKEDILVKIKKYYIKDNNVFDNKNLDNIIKKRVDDIMLAKNETKKRLSVSYTNHGIIQRHNNDYDNAMASYKQALKLWKANRNAKNNINVLLGRPIEEATTIEKLFPEDREK